MLELAREATEEIAATPEAFREALESARDDGIDVPTDPEALEQLRKLRLDDFTVTVPNFVFMQVLSKGLDRVLRPLAARHWVLYRAEDAEFIACDRPVSVSAEDPHVKGRIAPSADLWSSESDVAFPLMKSLMIVGTAVRTRGAQVAIADRRQVAALNSLTIARGMEFYCWSGGEFVWLMADGAVGGLDEMTEALSEVRRA